ncbi:MAG: hypothetical protein IKB09_01465 [Oscillospiraceae bacterium]|nr:hypothetical protein [Oscillospiraceae bacterium]
MQYDMSQLMQLAKSPAGQQLISYLQQHGGQEFRNAMAKAGTGDFHAAKQQLSLLLSSDEAQNLIKQLEDHV